MSWSDRRTDMNPTAFSFQSIGLNTPNVGVGPGAVATQATGERDINIVHPGQGRCSKLTSSPIAFGSQLSLVAPSFSSTQTSPTVALPVTTAAQNVAAATVAPGILVISITDLRDNHRIWHFIVVHAQDLFLEFVFREPGGSFLDTENPARAEELAGDALRAIYMAYVTAQMQLDPAKRVLPEPSKSPAIFCNTP